MGFSAASRRVSPCRVARTRRTVRIDTCNPRLAKSDVPRMARLMTARNWREDAKNPVASRGSYRHLGTPAGLSTSRRAAAAIAFAANPCGEHLPFGVVAALPASRPVVGVGTAAIRMQRLQQESALYGIPGNDQTRNHAKGFLRFFLIPFFAALTGQRGEAHLPSAMAVVAADMSFARSGEDVLHARAEELEIHSGCWRRHVAIGRQTANPLEDGLILGVVTRGPVRATGVSQAARPRLERLQQQVAVLGRTGVH